MLKRAFDILLSGLALLILLPVMALIAVAIVTDSGWPAFYRQERVGRGFQRFLIWKFRSMTVSSEGPRITVGGDTRVTRVGKLLRTTKLDELPQFWNVLRGDMSLVGPRPEIPEYVEMFAGRYKEILTLRPGITDLASLEFRDEENALASVEDPITHYARHLVPAKLDLAEEYLRKRSLRLDLSILARTFGDCLTDHIKKALSLAATAGNKKSAIVQGQDGPADRRPSANRHGWMRRPLIWAVQGGIFALAGITAFLLRFDLSIPRQEIVDLAYGLPVLIVMKSIAFRVGKLDRGWWQFVSLDDVPRLILGNIAGSLLAALAVLWIVPLGFPRSIYFIDLLVCSLLTAGIRLAVRTFAEASKLQVSSGKKRTLIFGAGEAGVLLLKEIRRNSSLPYHAVGFIDDNAQKSGLVIHGARVLGNGAGLSTAAKRHRIDTVLIAIPSASGQQMAQMLGQCQQAGVSFKTVPGLGEIIERKGLAKQIRDVAVEDLLGRSQVHLEGEAITRKLEGRIILVTGAAGSIGSELCRQIARFRPAAIVGYEISETALFYMDLEMKERFPGISFRPVIGSVQEPQRLTEVLDQYQPSILYHAAAYKHVPMMEAHPFEALANNVFGTYATALVAEEHGIEDFVMISTDKAVRPTSIMGVTKRVAELAVNSLQNGRTRFVSVRFGNVLGSSGSVVPLFKKQIAAGGPVRVTHPEMRRYFMTIPEAAQLVLQASTMGNGGEIFVLDMGEPVKIVDLARNLILLSGLRPDDDIRIEFTGTRPGEKLYEELLTLEESTVPTRHEKVKIFTGPSAGYEEMRKHIETLRQICAARDGAELILRFKEIVPEYNPSASVLRRTWAAMNQRNEQRTEALAN